MAATHDILHRLVDAGVEFVLIGGLAAVAHGSQFVTEDVDVCAPLSASNLQRIVAALNGLNARFSKSGCSDPLPDDPGELLGFKNLYLDTSQGPIDLLSEVDGLGQYEQVNQGAIEMDFGEYRCRVLGIDALIAAKQAINRPKDKPVIIELMAIRERLRETS